jgi:hypothetical protein
VVLAVYLCVVDDGLVGSDNGWGALEMVDGVGPPVTVMDELVDVVGL